MSYACSSGESLERDALGGHWHALLLRHGLRLQTHTPASTQARRSVTRCASCDVTLRVSARRDSASGGTRSVCGVHLRRRLARRPRPSLLRGLSGTTTSMSDRKKRKLSPDASAAYTDIQCPYARSDPTCLFSHPLLRFSSSSCKNQTQTRQRPPRIQFSAHRSSQSCRPRRVLVHTPPARQEGRQLGPARRRLGSPRLAPATFPAPGLAHHLMICRPAQVSRYGTRLSCTRTFRTTPIAQSAQPVRPLLLLFSHHPYRAPDVSEARRFPSHRGRNGTQAGYTEYASCPILPHTDTRRSRPSVPTSSHPRSPTR